MKSIAKRSLTLALSILLLVGTLGTNVFADYDTPVDDPLDPDPYTYVDLITSGLFFEGNVAKCTSSVDLNPNYYTRYVTLTMTLQRAKTETATTWEEVNSWSVSNYGAAAMTRRWAVTSGYYYQVYVEAKVKYSSGTATILETADVSSTVYY